MHSSDSEHQSSVHTSLPSGHTQSAQSEPAGRGGGRGGGWVGG